MTWIRSENIYVQNIEDHDDDAKIPAGQAPESQNARLQIFAENKI